MCWMLTGLALLVVQDYLTARDANLGNSQVSYLGLDVWTRVNGENIHLDGENTRKATRGEREKEERYIAGGTYVV